MHEVLDESLHFVVSEEVDWVSDGVKLLLEIAFERVHNKFDFDVAVGGEDLSGVNLVHFEAPFVQYDDVVLEVDDLNVGVSLVELCDCLFCEMALQEEISVRDKEVWVRFLDIALKRFPESILKSLEVTVVT